MDSYITHTRGVVWGKGRQAHYKGQTVPWLAVCGLEGDTTDFIKHCDVGPKSKGFSPSTTWVVRFAVNTIPTI